MPPAAAVAGAGAGSIVGSIIQGNATEDAAQKQADAANHASDLQYQMYQQQRTDQEPWRQAGIGALGQMQDPSFQHDFSASDFQEDPGYQFRMQQGQKALEASAAARGGLLSGNTGQALTDYGQNFASNEYQNAYNRFTNNQTNRFNRLASLAGVGQQANSQMGQASQNYGNNMSGLMTGLANAQGAAGIAQANSWGNTLSGIGNNWMTASMLNRMVPQKQSLGGLGSTSLAQDEEPMPMDYGSWGQ